MGVKVRVECADTLQRPEEERQKKREHVRQLLHMSSNFNCWGEMLLTRNRIIIILMTGAILLAGGAGY